jgi:cell division protein FtsA
MDLGVTVIDMGAGTTSIAVFFEGAMIFADLVALGGASITNDIARGLSTPVVHAERMKTLYGSALAAQGDDREVITVPQVGEDETDSATHVPRSMLTGIIRPRLEEIFELVQARLQASGVEAQAGRRVVLTGGASQLTGARELAQRVLNKQTRLGRPLRLSGLAEATGGSAFATCAGLLSYAQMSPHEAPDESDDRIPDSQRASWARFSQWLKENL